MNDIVSGIAARETLTSSCHIELDVADPTIVAELLSYREGDERNIFAVKALQVGVLAMHHARGRIDVDLIRQEGDRFLAGLTRELDSHKSTVQDQVSQVLREYFDPGSGRFNERVERLVQSGGDIEQLLRAHIGQADSELAKTLAAHFGENSPLMRMLSPRESEGILNSMTAALSSVLEDQRARILREFSLDNSGSALARLVSQLRDKHGELTKAMQEKVDEVIDEFSLDNRDSALSRLVNQVELAQRKISSEFSLDEDRSALARMKRELAALIETHNKANEEFREHVRTSLAGLLARREEAKKSPRHGAAFEQALLDYVEANALAAGDLMQRTGNTTGLIKNCKIGDAVLSIGPEREAAGAMIVLEAKERIGYDLKKALLELEEGRKNRGAKVGVFVFSKCAAPSGVLPLCRYGSDIVVVWDAEDATTDVYLDAALSIARALCLRVIAAPTKIRADWDSIQKAINEVERQSHALEDIRKGAQTIRGTADKIEDRVRIVSENVLRASRSLNEDVAVLKQAVSSMEGAREGGGP